MLCAGFLVTTAGAPLRLHAQRSDIALASTSFSIDPASLTSISSGLELPDAPGALQGDQQPRDAQQERAQQGDASKDGASSQTSTSAAPPQQTKRVLGIVPNFSSVSAGTKLPPQTAKEKLVLAGKNSFDYSSFLVAGIQAGFAMDSNSYPEFHQGLKGYGRYFWHTLADTADENFMVGGLGPIVFRQDSRFYTLGHGGFRKRSFYAVTRVLVSRSDDGNSMFNFSEIVGSGAAAGLSTVYYPKQYQTWTKVGQKWLTSDLIDGFNFFWKEWWPDVNKKVFHTK
jgi:hypothetical protein